jgi:hypothetical protein
VRARARTPCTRLRFLVREFLQGRLVLQLERYTTLQQARASELRRWWLFGGLAALGVFVRFTFVVAGAVGTLYITVRAAQIFRPSDLLRQWSGGIVAFSMVRHSCVPHLCVTSVCHICRCSLTPARPPAPPPPPPPPRES